MDESAERRFFIWPAHPIEGHEAKTRIRIPLSTTGDLVEKMSSVHCRFGLGVGRSAIVTSKRTGHLFCQRLSPLGPQCWGGRDGAVNLSDGLKIYISSHLDWARMLIYSHGLLRFSSTPEEWYAGIEKRRKERDKNHVIRNGMPVVVDGSMGAAELIDIG